MLEYNFKIPTSSCTIPPSSGVYCSSALTSTHGLLFILRWSNNGWINAAGNPVANQDLIRVASDLDDRLKEEGSVKYIWIPRADNQDADDACNDRMDQGQ